jgi:hypothetical protein
VAVFDCCLFSGETDQLLIRLTELDSVVSHFVIAESTVSFQGDPKALSFPSLLDSGRLDEWADKIIYVPVEDVPGPGGDRGAAESRWFMVRESFIRDALWRGYSPYAHADDMVMISDVDEIPKVMAVGEASRRLRNSENCLVFCQDMYVWNRRFVWPGPSWNTCAFLAGYGITPQESRNMRGSMIERGHIVENGGWHLTWQGTPEERKQKLMTFSHAEHNDKLEALEVMVSEGHDINGVQLSPVDVDSVEWPKYFDTHKELWL